MGSNQRASIALKIETREKLIEIGKKNQSYDQIIRELMVAKNKLNSLECMTVNQNKSSESIHK